MTSTDNASNQSNAPSASSQLPPHVTSAAHNDNNPKSVRNYSSSTAASFAEKTKSYRYPHCRDVNRHYAKVTKIGQGTFGEVHKAQSLENPEKFVALKKILMEAESEGFPITALREIKILKLLKHENIVELIEVCRSSGSPYSKFSSTIYLVFEFCDHDLAGLLSNTAVQFSLGETKKVMLQLFNGIYYIHSNKILHRDIKASNVFVTKAGILKLGDFGLARAFSHAKPNEPNRYTNRVVTMWYRPPELLLGERNYTPAIDMWGAGAVMCEMWTRSPIMQGKNEINQLTLISQLCGSITTEVWPNVDKLELYNKFELPKNNSRLVKDRLKLYVKNKEALDLIDKLLTLDPARRLDADNALNHDFFWTDPMPIDLTNMLSRLKNSYFEFLAPRRPPRNMPAHRPPQIQQHLKESAPTNYDRVF